MPTGADVSLAKRLLAASVVTQTQVREALAIQDELLRRGKTVSLVRVLVAKTYLPPGADAILRDTDPIAAQPFASYRLERALGEGGSGVVYEATYLPNRARVAVKVFDAVQSLRPDRLERFEEEARLLIEIAHENVVAGYEVGCEHGLHFFSMELIDGLTVLEMIERFGSVEPTTALWVTAQLARGLAHLHAAGLLHRDIKPGNVMVDRRGRARMIDLGLVRRLASGSVSGGEAAAEENTTVGTVEYISPEQARGRGDLDVRTDIYSLGVSLYHMVVGDVPFHGDSSYEVMAKHILAGLDAAKVKVRRVPPEVHYLITKMMSKEREYRFADAAQVAREIEGFLPPGGPPPLALPVAAPPERAAPARAAPVAVAPVARPAARPVARPVAPPVVRPAAKPAAAPIVVPPVARPASRPASPPVARPATSRPATPPVVPPVAKPAAPGTRPPRPGRGDSPPRRRPR